MRKWIASIRANGLNNGRLAGILIGTSFAMLLIIVVVMPVQSNLQRGSDRQYVQEWGRPTAAPIVERGNITAITHLIGPTTVLQDVGIRYDGTVTHLIMTEAETSGPTVNVWHSSTEGLWFGGNGSHPPIGSGDTVFGVFATVLVMVLWLCIWAMGFVLEIRYNELRDEEFARQKEALLRQQQSAMHEQLLIDLEEHFRDNPPDPQEFWAARAQRLQRPTQ
jgi:hypothetical protein